MNQSLVVLAGSSGDLGIRIARELISLNARVRSLVRKETTSEKRQMLHQLGVEVVDVDFNQHQSLVEGCRGGSVVVSTLSGLSDTIVVGQTQLLNAAVEAKVPRFIPSDFAIDYTKVPMGTNRNLNFRREFKEIADRADIQVTSILNGAFSDMLTGVAPFILFKIKRVLCWGNGDQLMDWTTIDDTARFTAFAAMDSSTPRFLKIAGDQVSANGLAKTMTELTGENYWLLKPGGIGMLNLFIAVTRRLAPSENEVFPAWQGMQYMRDQFQGLAKFDHVDNARYPISWKTTRDVLAAHLKKQ